MHCLEDEGKGSKGSEAAGSDQGREREGSSVASKDSRSEAKKAETRESERARAREERMRVREGTIRIKRRKKQKRRRKKNDDAAGREPARLARQVQRTRMQRYEATNSHNYTWIAELRPDFDMFRAREETHFLAIGILATNRCNGCFCKLY